MSNLNIQELVSSGANIQVTANASDLISCFRSVIKEVRDEFEREILTKKTETYATPDEASVQLRVDRSTLWRWAKTGYLIPIEVGGKILYKQSDIDIILNK